MVDLELEQRKKDALKTLPYYRGEVLSKNDIRKLPGVKEGMVFWVSMDHKAYVVSKIEGDKVSVSPLDEGASISTGITIYEMNKSIVEKEPLFDFENATKVEKTRAALHKWFDETTRFKEHYMLYGREIHYFTLIVKKNPATVVYNPLSFIKTYLNAVGDIISIDIYDDNNEPKVEIWVKTPEHGAQLFYLFPCDDIVAHI